MSEALGVSQNTIYRAARRGELKIYKPARSSLLKLAEVQAWVEARTAALRRSA